MRKKVKMAEKKAAETNPWTHLSTITTFDKGNDSWTTRLADEKIEPQNGGQVVGRITPSTSLLIESLIQQLCTVFEGDNVRRNKLYFAICDRLHEMKLIDGSYNMEEFEMIRGQYQRALYHLVTVARASTGSESALQVPSCLMSEWSRYRREFHELGFIAAGGFGNVFRALHRLDGSEYAIKKIVVRSGRVKTIMQHLEEVKTLAKLNHTNIVSYKGAWIESTLPSTFVPNVTTGKPNVRGVSPNSKNNANIKSKNSRSCNESGQGAKVKSRTYRTGMYIAESYFQRSVAGSSGGYVVSHDIVNERFLQLNSSTNIIGNRISHVERSHRNQIHVEEIRSDVVSFRDEKSDKNSSDESNQMPIVQEATSDSSVSFRNDSKENSRNSNSTGNDDDNHVKEVNHSTDNNSSDGSDSHEESVSDRRICQYNDSPMNQQYATLYIQMALCEKTLQQWLDERVETPNAIITAIITQILCGLDYIHSVGIVHHDIKPSNIFISTKGHLQIQLGDFGLACPLQRENHRAVLGTHLYAAPEQLRGECNPKSDVYSLGIVLLELLVPMHTYMERSRCIGALKAGQIPTALTANYPKWAHIVSQLVQKNPDLRPTTSELLLELNEDKDTIIMKLKDENDKKNNTIEELREKVAKLEDELAKLKIRLGDT